jgi:hypothetical protein
VAGVAVAAAIGGGVQEHAQAALLLRVERGRVAGLEAVERRLVGDQR